VEGGTDSGVWGCGEGSRVVANFWAKNFTGVGSLGWPRCAKRTTLFSDGQLDLVTRV